jgi:lysyl-tRNA synthetase class 1
MFLDEEGHKVSKSVGRGVTVDQWTRYAPIEVLKYFLLLNPRRARKLFLEAIPQYVDEYLDAVREYAAASEEQRRESILEYVIQSTTPRRFNSSLTFTMMTNVAAAVATSNRDQIWNYIVRYDPLIAGDPETERMGRALMECAINFRRDFIAGEPYAPSDMERALLKRLADYLRENQNASAEDIEKKIYDLGRENYEKPGKIFPLLYRSILGQQRGPRLGAFIRLATPARVVELIEATIARSA